MVNNSSVQYNGGLPLDIMLRYSQHDAHFVPIIIVDVKKERHTIIGPW